MGLSLTHLLVVLLIVFVVFGAGKLPNAMKDIGKGVRNLREGMKADEAEGTVPEPKRITANHTAQANEAAKKHEML